MPKITQKELEHGGFSASIVIVAVVILAGLVGGGFYMRKAGLVPERKLCTAEAMLCPDGKTSVGRTGPNCEFAECPEDIPKVKTDTSTWKIYSDKIVYTTDQSVDVEMLKRDCVGRAGTFNTCGSPCPSGAEICAGVCAFTCELKK